MVEVSGGLEGGGGGGMMFMHFTTYPRRGKL